MFAAFASALGYPNARHVLHQRYGVSLPLLQRLQDPIVIGSFALHTYMGMPTSWSPDDVDIAVSSSVNTRFCTADDVRREVVRMRELAERDGLSRVETVSVNDHLVEKFPELYALVNTHETRELQATLERMVPAAVAARAAAAADEEEQDLALQTYANTLDADVALVQRAQVSFAAFQELKHRAHQSDRTDPHFAALFDVMTARDGFREHFHDSVVFVLTCRFPELFAAAQAVPVAQEATEALQKLDISKSKVPEAAPVPDAKAQAFPLKKHQIVSISVPSGISLSQALSETTDQPASVQLNMDGSFHVSGRTREIIRIMTLRADEICAVRRPKYETRGFTVVA